MAEPPHLSGTEKRTEGGRLRVRFLGWDCVWLGDEKKEAPGAMGMFEEIAANAEQLLERIEKEKGEAKAAGQQQQPAPDPNAFIKYLEFMDTVEPDKLGQPGYEPPSTDQFRPVQVWNTKMNQAEDWDPEKDYS